MQPKSNFENFKSVYNQFERNLIDSVLKGNPRVSLTTDQHLFNHGPQLLSPES